MEKLKVAVVTTSRADYGLLYPLILKMKEDQYFEMQLVVTGGHLEPDQGNTIEIIKSDGFIISYIVPTHMQSDSENDVSFAISEGMKGFSRIFKDSAPDLLIVLGDRYELLSACLPALIHKIPVAHIHGGEVTYGAFDDPIRHSITKMSALHFPTIELYKKRIIQMGENPERVFVVGALGIDNIKSMELMDQNQISEYSGIDFSGEVALMTFHPVTLDSYDEAGSQIREVMESLLETSFHVLITMPNTDTGGKRIFEVISEYIGKYPWKFRMVKSLGQRAYLSAMKYAKLMIGNSSSGILESASFKLPVVNIGDRQAGRYKPKNVIDCDCTKDSITKAINKAISYEFSESIRELENPYGNGDSTSQIINTLKIIDFRNKSKILKKEFFDLIF